MIRWAAVGVCWAAVGVSAWRWTWVRFPVFTLWLVALGVYWSVWTGMREQYYCWEPIMFGLRFAAAAELFGLVCQTTPVRERQWMLAVVAAIAALLVYVGLEGFDGQNMLETFRSVRRLANLGLAALVGGGAAIYWIRPPRMDRQVRRHALVVTAIYSLYAAIGFVPRLYKYTARDIFFGGMGLCLIAWMRM